ncbi:MAG TPA: DNA-directed RNA polymerase subunit L [Candidatus Thermoplasmatota archaeon]|nr:DNA-directed RNA polymerase subunit L [Candidatus Thermoplasmatota archaeon]
MKLNVVNHSGNELEVEVHGENETLLNPIKQALLADKDVDFAEYIIEHPSLAVPKIYLRTKGKAKPDVVLKRTVKGLIAEFDAFETAFASQLRKRA